jgi:tetratricopeptide (TPR) repeat protein
VKRSTVIGLFRAAIVIALVAFFLWLGRSPPVGVKKSPPTPAPTDNTGWERGYQKATSNLGTMEETARARQEFVDRYPRSPGSLNVLNQLGDIYARTGKFDKSIRSYEAAQQLLASGFTTEAPMKVSAGILQVNLAETYRLKKDFAEAEALLRELMSKPLPPAVEVETYVPQVLVAPTTLARVLRDQGKPREADQLLVETANRAIELNELHPGIEWIESYAAAAYMQRVNAALESNPANVSEARRLAEEFHTRLPNYGEGQGYQQMVESIQMYQSRHAGDARKEPTTTADGKGT